MTKQLMHPALARLVSREQIEQRTPPWFAMRGNMITASQVASVLGCCPYKSAVQLLKEKVWPELRANSDTFATNWGNNYEADAIQKYEKLTGKKVLNFGLLQHLEHDWIGASPDGVAVGGPDDAPVGIEVKCPVSREITQEVPGHYMPQIQLQLEVMDLEEADFVQVTSDSQLKDGRGMVFAVDVKNGDLNLGQSKSNPRCIQVLLQLEPDLDGLKFKSDTHHLFQCLVH